MIATAEYLNELEEQRTALAESLNNLGIETEKSETFNSLIAKVPTILDNIPIRYINATTEEVPHLYDFKVGTYLLYGKIPLYISNVESSTNTDNTFVIVTKTIENGENITYALFFHTIMNVVRQWRVTKTDATFKHISLNDLVTRAEVEKMIDERLGV